MNAVIYCRVSSKEQVDGTSLESQELACKEYAARSSLNVVRTFIERGESAKFADRPQLLEMLSFSKDRGHKIEQLLVWKVDRLARNVGDHFNIKAALGKYGVRVVSVTEPIDAKPEGKLLETILAGFAQFDNDIRAARCIQGMRRKIQEGLFPWGAPLGYKSANRPGSKKTLPDVPDYPVFGIIQKGLEEFAVGGLTKAQLMRVLTERGLRTKRGKPLTNQAIDWLLADSFYAGIVRDPWSGEEFQGKHIPAISQETFRKIQRVIAGRGRSVPHLAVRDEFPLRTFARCGNCEATLTGSFSRGRSARYPYYRCFRRGCDAQASYPLAEVHREFAGFLNALSLDNHTFAHLKDSVRRIGESWGQERYVEQEHREAEAKRANDRFQQLLRLKMDDLITDEEFKTQRAKLSLASVAPKSQPSENGSTLDEVMANLDAIRSPLTDLHSFWSSLNVESQQRFQLLTLPVGFVVGRVGTARRGHFFSLFRSSLPAESCLVPPVGESWNQLSEEIGGLAVLLRESCRSM